MMNYYYLNDLNEQIGPLSLDAIKKKNLPKSTLVWREGLATWMPAGKIPELNTSFVNWQNMGIIEILLLVYAGLGSVVLLVIGKFVAAFVASLFNTYPYIPPIVVFVLGMIVLVVSFFYKKRKYCLLTGLVLLPILLSTLFSIFYYNVNHAYRYHFGHCVIEKSSGCGVLNRWGGEYIPCIYDNLSPIRYGYEESDYRVRYRNKYGILNAWGQEVIPCEFDAIAEWGNSRFFRVTLSKNLGHSLCGLYTKTGEVVIPCEYEKLYHWRKTALICVEQGDKQGLYTENGECVLECKYTICKLREDGFSKINMGGRVDNEGTVSGGSWGMIDEQGETIVPCKYKGITVQADRIEARQGALTDYYDFDGNYLRSSYEWF